MAAQAVGPLDLASSSCLRSRRRACLSMPAASHWNFTLVAFTNCSSTTGADDRQELKASGLGYYHHDTITSKAQEDSSVETFLCVSTWVGCNHSCSSFNGTYELDSDTPGAIPVRPVLVIKVNSSSVSCPTTPCSVTDCPLNFTCECSCALVQATTDPSNCYCVTSYSQNATGFSGNGTATATATATASCDCHRGGE